MLDAGDVGEAWHAPNPGPQILPNQKQDCVSNVNTCVLALLMPYHYVRQIYVVYINFNYIYVVMLNKKWIFLKIFVNEEIKFEICVRMIENDNNFLQILFIKLKESLCASKIMEDKFFEQLHL